MFDKLKLKKVASSITLADPAATDDTPSKRQIFHNRSNYGVNLGLCFVLERWIYGSLFTGNEQTELQVVSRLVNQQGADKTRETFEKHWTSYMSDSDWQWLQDHNVTSVRVPLGYWDVGGGEYTNNTKYQNYGKSVYKNAWLIFKSYFVEKAASHNISVIIDIHGLPYGANGDAHSGEDADGNAGFWNDSQAQLLVCKMLQFIAQDVKGYDNIAAIQVVNEAVFSSDGKKQATYYSAAINLIRNADKEIPIVISDGWWPDQWVKWVQSNQPENTSLGVVVDDHCYRCVSDSDKAKSVQQIIHDLDGDFLTNLTNNGEGVDFVLGEYSCVLDSESWKKDNGEAQRADLVKQFGQKEIQLLKTRAPVGSYFWTFKFEAGSGGEWDFKAMTSEGAVLPPYNLKGKEIPNDDTFNSKLKSSLDAHEAYWKKANPNEKYEFYRYKEGYTTGWNDSLNFAKFDGSVIGRVYAWKVARRAQHISKHGSLSFLWEWDQGFSSGMDDFINTMAG